jgi:predicted secreted protein
MLHSRVANHKVCTTYRWMLLWLAALLGVLCAARQSAAVTVHLDEQDAASTVILHTGDRLRVELPAAPATGYRWKAKLIDASHLQLLSKDLRPDNRRLTSAGTQVFAWKAISPGHAEIRLVYDRPEDRSELPGENHPNRKQNEVSIDVLAGELTPGSVESSIDSPLVTVGQFRGTLPCATCLGIVVDLTLFASDNHATSGTVFVERWTYKSTSGASQVHAGTGKWTVLHGTYADPSMTVYVLGSPFMGQENFALKDGSLVQLDDQMLPVKDDHGKEIALQASP